MRGPAVVVHGGAGNPAPERVHDEAPFHAALEQAVRAAIDALPEGAVAAACAAVELLEDAPIFNAGRGSVPTTDGTVEMDAAVMDGRAATAGSVAGVTTVRHPIALARTVMERSAHVMLIGRGAEEFAAEQRLETMDPAWFLVPDAERPSGPGTVGAVVLDERGALAAATSTGGRRDQPPGRVGDSPLIGAGTFADGRRAISMTGDGERIITTLSAYAIATSPAPLDQACDDAVAALGGAHVGLIAVDRDGNLAMPFNTGVMHRGWWRGGSAPVQTLVHQ